MADLSIGEQFVVKSLLTLLRELCFKTHGFLCYEDTCGKKSQTFSKLKFVKSQVKVQKTLFNIILVASLLIFL